jgi:hypothetical protein
MNSMLSFVPPLAAAALCALAVRPAAAQQAATAENARPVVQQAAAADSAPLRTVAAYRFAAVRDAGLPTQVTVADSVGELVASFRLANDRAERPMAVDVIATDLVLQGETPSGPLTVLLYRQNDGDSAGAVAGRWWLGARQGELRGQAAR